MGGEEHTTPLGLVQAEDPVRQRILTILVHGQAFPKPRIASHDHIAPALASGVFRVSFIEPVGRAH